MPTETKNKLAPEVKLRHHIYDGIQEFDNRLPNWWLWTLYGAILFAFAYWFYYHGPNPAASSGERVTQKMARIAVAAAKKSGGDLTDDQLWSMSRDPQVIAAGRTTFQTSCAPCHMADLSGKIGPNLKVTQWIHGGLPHEVVATITNGVPVKGMPTWGPALGKQKIAGVAAYVLSYHKQGEPIIIVASKPVGAAK